MVVEKDTINIWGLKIHNVDYNKLLEIFNSTIESGSMISVTYSNVNTLNLIFKNNQLLEKLNKFDIIHPDGIGVYLASRFLFTRFGLKRRITGSDFYPLLVKTSIDNNWKVFFFGHDELTLKKIRLQNPHLKIADSFQGYNFDENTLIKAINATKPEILVVGLGCPMQEEWILRNQINLNCNVLLSVGNGMQVFANTKIRGPKIVRLIGLEWLIRLLTNPSKYWRRYLIGNYLFLVRIIRTKMTKLLRK